MMMCSRSVGQKVKRKWQLSAAFNFLCDLSLEMSVQSNNEVLYIYTYNFMCICIYCINESILYALKSICQFIFSSSACFPVNEKYNRVEIQREKSRGPSPEPWGTPDFTSAHSDGVLSQETHFVLSDVCCLWSAHAYIWSNIWSVLWSNVQLKDDRAGRTREDGEI